METDNYSALIAEAEVISQEGHADDLITIALDREADSSVRLLAVRAVLYIDDGRRADRLSAILEGAVSLLKVYGDIIEDAGVAMRVMDGVGELNERSLRGQLQQVSLDGAISDDLVRSVAVKAWIDVSTDEELTILAIRDYAVTLNLDRGIVHLINYAGEKWGYDISANGRASIPFLAWLDEQCRRTP